MLPSLTIFDSLLPSQTERLEWYSETLGVLKRSARIMSTDICMFNLDQSSKQLRISLDGATSSKLGTLITRNTCYHSGKHAVLLALGQAQVQGWPVTAVDVQDGGCLHEFEKLLRDKSVSRSKLVACLGDAWHIPCQGLMFMDVLGNIEFSKVQRCNVWPLPDVDSAEILGGET